MAPVSNFRPPDLISLDIFAASITDKQTKQQQRLRNLMNDSVPCIRNIYLKCIFSFFL